MADRKYIDKGKEATLVLLALRAANNITATGISKETIQNTRETLDQMDALYDSIVEEAESRERTVLESQGS
jgi:hypothetical protein